MAKIAAIFAVVILASASAFAQIGRIKTFVNDKDKASDKVNDAINKLSKAKVGSCDQLDAADELMSETLNTITGSDREELINYVRLSLREEVTDASALCDDPTLPLTTKLRAVLPKVSPSEMYDTISGSQLNGLTQERLDLIKSGGYDTTQENRSIKEQMVLLGWSKPAEAAGAMAQSNTTTALKNTTITESKVKENHEPTTSTLAPSVIKPKSEEGSKGNLTNSGSINATTTSSKQNSTASVATGSSGAGAGANGNSVVNRPTTEANTTTPTNTTTSDPGAGLSNGNKFTSTLIVAPPVTADNNATTVPNNRTVADPPVAINPSPPPSPEPSPPPPPPPPPPPEPEPIKAVPPPTQEEPLPVPDFVPFAPPPPAPVDVRPAPPPAVTVNGVKDDPAATKRPDSPAPVGDDSKEDDSDGSGNSAEIPNPEEGEDGSKTLENSASQLAVHFSLALVSFFTTFSL